MLRDAYRYPVDVEFTGNFLADGELRLNLVQCRPLQVREGGAIVPAPSALPEDRVLLRSRGPIVGPSAHTPIDRVVYVDPDAYVNLGTGDRHEVARVIGRLMRLDPDVDRKVMLLGPGRWGTTTVALGVPVSFAEIQRVSVLCEIMRIGDVVPDVSLGSHFFNDLVEESMLYVALYPAHPGHLLDEPRLRGRAEPALRAPARRRPHGGGGPRRRFHQRGRRRCSGSTATASGRRRWATSSPADAPCRRLLQHSNGAG